MWEPIIGRMDISTPPATELRSCFDAQHRASRSAPEVPLAQRLDRLQRISTLLDTHGAANAAVGEAYNDLGCLRDHVLVGNHQTIA